ncbi:MAG: GHKL domain-containing protein, partial [Erysipelotrichales bacterium]|nr:GHKL domain-containing protein [Erysipelotrichales bacterium]
RMDEQADSLEKTDTDMTALVKDVWEPFEVLAEKEGHTLKLQIEENVRAKVHTSSIRQLCSILADNAVKYTRKGGEITLALSSKGKSIRISSENPAEGFEKGDQDVLFDRFYRKDADRNSATGGSGIGLSLARSITEAHGGTIKAHSDGEILRIEANI